MFLGIRRLSNLERAQTSAFQKLAGRYGYSYSKEDDAHFIDYLRDHSKLNFIPTEGTSTLFNIISGDFEASTVHAFTYKYETDPSEFDSNDIGSTFFTLAVLFRGFRQKLPVFSLFPRKAEVNVKSGIELTGSDKFNKRYVLNSDDEATVRSLLEPLAERLANHKVTQTIYCDGEKILFTYGGNCTGKLVEKRIDSAHDVFTMLK